MGETTVGPGGESIKTLKLRDKTGAAVADLGEQGFKIQGGGVPATSRNGHLATRQTNGCIRYQYPSGKKDILPVAFGSRTGEGGVEVNDVGDLLIRYSSSTADMLVRKFTDPVTQKIVWATRQFSDDALPQGWSGLQIHALANAQPLAKQRELEALTPSAYPPKPEDTPAPMLGGVAMKDGKQYPVLLIAAEVKAHQDKNGPQGSMPKYNNSPSVGNATNLFSVWPDEEIILKVKMPPPFDQQGNLSANLIKWNVPGHTFADNILEARMKWGVNFFNSALNTKEITITIGGSEFKVHTKVQGTGILSQAEGAALVPHAAPVMLAYKFEAENYTNTTFPISPKRDAIRHAYWCSLSVSTFPVTAGDVPLISTGHERDNRYDGKQQAFNTTMDLKNNDVGTSVRYQVNGFPDKAAIKQALEQLYTAGEMYVWEIPAGAASASQGDSEGIVTKSDGTRIHR